MKTRLLALVCGGIAGGAVAATEVVNGVPWTYQVVNGQAIIQCEPRYWCWDYGMVEEEEQPPPYGTPLAACDNCHGRGTACRKYDVAAIPEDTTGVLRVPATLGGKPVKQIGQRAFAMCSMLTEIILPEGVTTIGDEAFYSCDALTLTLPSTFTCKAGSGETAFHDSHIKTFHVAEGNPSVRVLNGFLCSKDGKTLIAAPCPLQASVLPSSIEHIAPGAFDTFGCDEAIGSEAYALQFPRGLKTIGERAFAHSELFDVAIPEGVTKVGAHAFDGCRVLGSIAFPSTLKTIESHTASGIDTPLEIALAEGVTTLRERAFGGSDIATVTVPASVQTIEGGALPAKRLYFKGKPPAHVHDRAFDPQFGATATTPEVSSSSEACLGEGFYPLNCADAWAKVMDAQGMWRGLKMTATASVLQAPNELWYDKKAAYVYQDGALYERMDAGKLHLVKVVDPTLTTFTIPKNAEIALIDAREIFDDCPQLTTIKVEDGHPYLTARDGVLYEVAQNQSLIVLVIPRAARAFTIPRACTELDSFTRLIRYCPQVNTIKAELGHTVAVVQGGVLFQRKHGYLVPTAIVPTATAITLPKESMLLDESLFNYLIALCPQLATIAVEAGHPSYVESGGVVYEKMAPTDYRPIAIPPARTSITVDANCIRVVELGGLISQTPKLGTIRVADKHPCAVVSKGVLYYNHGEYLTLAGVPPTATTVTLDKRFKGLYEGLYGAGANIFTACPNLTAIHVEEGNLEFTSVDGVLYQGHPCMPRYLVAIPNQKRSVTLPQTVTSIRENAYRGKEPLELFFTGEPPLFDGFGYMAWDTLCETYRTETPTDPEVVVYYSSTVREAWAAELKGSQVWCNYPVAERTPLEVTYRVTGNTVAVTGLAAHSRVNTLEIPQTIEGKTVTAIDAGAFRNIPWLTEVRFPDAITSIGNDAFSGCTLLAVDQVVLPAALRTLGRGAFVGCKVAEPIQLAPGMSHACTRIGYLAPTQPSGFKLDLRRGLATAAFTKPGTYDAVLFNCAGDLEVLRYVVSELPVVTVVKEGADDNCKVSGAGAYLAKKQVTLVATVPHYATFEGWYEEGKLLSKAVRYSFSMGSADRQIVAKFATEPLTVAFRGVPMFGVVGEPLTMEVVCSSPTSALKSVKATALPKGMQLVKEGEQYRIVGTPTTAEERALFTVQAVNQKGVTVSQSVGVRINKEPIWLLSPLPEEPLITAWESTELIEISALSGLKSLRATALPPGLKLVNREGKWCLEGTPTQGGSYTVTLTATSVLGATQTFEIPLTVQVIPEYCVGRRTCSLYYYNTEFEQLVLGRGYLAVDAFANVYGLIAFEDGAIAEVDAPAKVLLKNETAITLEVPVVFYDPHGKKSHHTMELYLLGGSTEPQILF